MKIRRAVFFSLKLGGAEGDLDLLASVEEDVLAAANAPGVIFDSTLRSDQGERFLAIVDPAPKEPKQPRE